MIVEEEEGKREEEEEEEGGDEEEGELGALEMDFEDNDFVLWVKE